MKIGEIQLSIPEKIKDKFFGFVELKEDWEYLLADIENATHYDVTATVKTSKNQLVYTESGWDILKIADELCRKLERELSKHDDNRQKESIRKKEY